ncbi:hypothetical protein PInf_013636 [Phytophthora infestans]|nr:hypothetical protein PInf_013636 [Phytophthora infestans]
MRRSLLRTSLLLLFYLRLPTVAHADIAGASVTPASLNAGVVTDVAVTFTSGVDVDVDGSVLVEFPTGFYISSGTTVAVTATGSTTALSVVSVSSTQLSVLVRTTKISAGVAFGFTMTDVTNPGEQTTSDFTVSTYDSGNTLIERSAAVSGIAIAKTALAFINVVPDSLNAGVTGTVTVAFTSAVRLPVGSKVEMTFPSDFTVLSSTLSSATNIDSSSTVVTSGSVVTVTIAGSVVSAGSNVSLKLDGVTNPGAKTTGTFAVATTDSSSRVFQAGTAVSAVNIVSTTLSGVAVNVVNGIAGAVSIYSVDFTTNAGVPVGASVVLRVPIDYSLSGSISFVDSLKLVTWTGIVDGQSVKFKAVTPYAAGQHSVQVKFLENPVDGPSVLQMDAITAGNILGGRLWTAVNAVAGVTSDQTIELFLTGRMDPGGKFEFTLPDSQWSMAASGVATFIVPNLTDAAGSVVWDTVTRMMTVTLTGTTPILSYSGVTLLLRDVSNPPKEMGVNNAYLTTRAADNRIIDGPDTLSVMTISRGALAGTKTWASITTTSASMQSDQRFKFTLSGALPSGSIILVTLPAGGWRMANSAVSEVSFSLPVSGVTAHSVNWSPTTYELRVVTDGDMSEGTSVELLVEDMINPFSSSVAGTCTVTTMLSDAGVVAESRDIAVNAITSDVLATEGSLVSKVATPGVLSTQTITFTTGGKLEAGAKFCITFPDGWTLMASTFASLTLPAPTQSSPLTRELNATSHTLCMQTAVAINQETVVSIVLTDILSPESVRSEQGAKLVIQSHLGGNVNTGSIRMNAIAKGALTGPLMWQTLMLSPGPVAGLRTSASLAFKTTGHVAAGGSIVVELPFEWVMASTCKATFVRPAVLGKVACSQNNISILMSDDLVEATDVNISFTGVYNPPLVRPEGVASCRTMAPDGGEIDASNSVTTGAIVAAVTGITNSGDHLTAVVGLAKVFTFEGSALAENDVVKFVDASTSNDANCGESTTGQSDVGGVGVKYLSANRDVSVKFSQSSQDGKRFAVCYKFGHNPFKLYAALGIMVKEIQSVSSSVGFPDIAVADFVKTWTFNGNGISGGDQVRWIDLDVAQSAAYVSTPPDCLDTSTLAKLASPTSETLMAPEDAYTRIIQGDSNVSLAFSAESSGRTFCLCFKFGSEPFMVYPAIKIRVNDLQRIETTSTGSDAAAVANAPKSFKLLGDGVALNDRLYFVELGSVASCEESDNDKSLRLLHVINAQEQSVLFADGNLVTTINFDSFAAGMTVVPCYQFGMEPYQLYQSIRLTVKMVKRYTGTLGSPQLAVAEVPEPLTFLGYGLSGGDLVRWILNGEEDCESNLASLTDLNTLGRVDTIPLGSNSAAVFNFSSVQSDFNPVLCYKFGEENFKLYSEISIAIGTIRAKSPQTGAKEIAVAGSRKDFTLLGTNLAEGDRVGWTSVIDSSIPCSNLSLLIPNAMNLDNDYLSYLTSIYTFGVALSPLSSGKRVYLCYGFGQEPFKLFTDLYVDVKSITNMRALMGSPSVAVAGALKTFLFDGDGVATGDFAKFVSSSNSSDCTDPGVTLMNIIKEYDDYDEMAMFLYEISARTATGSFQASDDTKSAGLKRVLCYRFGAEPFVFYENFHIDVKTVWRLRQTSPKAEGQNNVVVVNEPKQMTIDGVGISVKDTMKFVNAGTNMKDSDCVDLPAQGRTKQHLQVATDLTVALPFEQGSNGSTWVLCYKFDDEPFRLYASIAITVKQITALLDYTFQDVASLGRVATIGHRKQWKPVGSGIQEGDTVKIVPQSVTSSLECGQADANIATGTATMRVDKKMTFSGTISAFPASTRDVYHLCYQFQDEAFTYIRDFTLTTYGIISMDRGVVLESATTTAQVSGFRLSDTDEMGWTTSSTTCTTILGRTEVSGMKASLNFADTYSRLYLCYSFDRQPFDIFKTVTLTVAKAEIWTPQIASVIADQTTEIVVSGTFGITQAQIKLRGFLPMWTSAPPMLSRCTHQ